MWTYIESHINTLMRLLFIILLTGCVTTQAGSVTHLENYKPWAWKSSECQNCQIEISPLKASAFNNDVYAFIYGLTSRKTELLELYQASGQDYNLLAHMAMGILGQESKFFESERYKIKENLPVLVTLAKRIRSFGGDDKEVSVNSRGPTQIKVIPRKIAERYNIDPSDLRNPEKAAIATMGFLIESLKELRTRIRVNKLDITEDQIVDYLPYIYFGAAGRLTKRTATPDTNIYVQEMKRYMSLFKIYEKPE